jgi:plastocyanin
MSEKIDPETADLSDRELIELLENHSIDRRTVLTALGVGGIFSLGSGVATAGHEDSHAQSIDPYYGYSAPADEDLPAELQPDHTVELHIGGQPPMFYFDPMGMQIDVGDVVRFDFRSPDHNVMPYHLEHGRQQRVPDSEEPFSSPVITPGGFWLYEFSHPGTYDLYCAPHQVFGMVMRLVVGDSDSEAYDGEFSEEGRPPVTAHELESFPGIDTWVLPTSADIFATDAMSVETIVDSGPVTKSDVRANFC